MNWGPGASSGFQNALATGLQMGNIARQREQQNAFLEQREDALNLRRQEVARKAMAEQDKANRQAEVARDRRLAMQGDAEAKSRLMTSSFEAWEKVDAADKAKIAEETELYGQAAQYALSKRDPRAIRQVVMGFAQQQGNNPEIMAIAQLSDQQMTEALQNAVFEAGLVKDLIAQDAPRYQAIPEGGTLVNTRDPQAVRTFQQGAPQYSEGQTATNPQTGERVIYRNGRWEPM